MTEKRKIENKEYNLNRTATFRDLIKCCDLRLRDNIRGCQEQFQTPEAMARHLWDESPAVSELETRIVCNVYTKDEPIEMDRSRLYMNCFYWWKDNVQSCRKYYSDPVDMCDRLWGVLGATDEPEKRIISEEIICPVPSEMTLRELSERCKEISVSASSTGLNIPGLSWVTWANAIWNRSVKSKRQTPFLLEKHSGDKTPDSDPPEAHQIKLRLEEVSHNLDSVLSVWFDQQRGIVRETDQLKDLVEIRMILARCRIKLNFLDNFVNSTLILEG